MPLMEDDHLIQTLLTDTANEPLDIGILPRTLWSSQYFLDAHMAHTLPKVGAVDTVPIAEEIAWRLVPGTRFDHLLDRPLGRGMLRHVDVDDPPSIVGEDHEHEEHTECNGRHREEIEGYHVLHVSLEERLPRWGG